MRQRFISAPVIQDLTLGYFTPVSITTPVVSALKNYYIIKSSLEVPTDILNRYVGFLAISEAGRLQTHSGY
jgi:hypothetical protein